MSYEMQLPDGSVVEVPDAMPPEQARQHMLHQFPDQFPGRKSGFVPAVKAGFDSGFGSSEHYGAALAEKAGFPSLAAYLKDKAAKNEQTTAGEFDPTTSEDKGFMARVRQYVTEPAGGMVGSMGPAMVAGAAGSAVAGPAGGVAGFMAPMAAQEAGENLKRQESNKQPQNLLSATVVGLAQAALDRFGFGKALEGVGASKFAMDEAAKLAPEVLSGAMSHEAATTALGGTLRNMALETAGSAATNTGIGVANEAMRRAQADQPVADQGALDAYKNTALTAGALAPIFGVAHGMGARAHAADYLGDVHNKGVVDRQGIAREQQELPEYQAQQANDVAQQEAQEAAAQQAAAQQEQDTAARNMDQSRRAVATVQQPGSLDPEHPLQMQPPAQTRDDATAAFTQNQPDLLGDFSSQEQPPAQPAPRAADIAPPEDTATAPLPLEPPAPVEPPAPNPNITTPDMFSAGVFPRAKIWKSGELVGKDLTNPNDVKGLISSLNKYSKNVENPERLQALNDTIQKLQDTHDALKTGEADGIDQVGQVPAGTDTAPVVGNMGVGDQRAAVPEGLPLSGRGGDSVGDGAAGEDVSGAGEQPAPATVEPVVVPPEELKTPATNITAAPTDTAVHDAVQAGDYPGVAAALQADPNPLIAKIGEMASGIKGVKIEHNPDATDLYNPASKTITVTDPTNTAVVAHEVAHSVMQTALDHPTKIQAPIVEGINNLFNHVSNKLSADAPYAVKDVHEFVAEGFSNKDFQNTLAKMKYANTTAWGRFTDYVAKMLGLKNDNALTEFLSLHEALQKTGLKAKTDTEAGALYAPPIPGSTLGEHDSIKPEQGIVGKAVDGINELVKTGRAANRGTVAKAIDDLAWKLEQKYGDSFVGITRHLPESWRGATLKDTAGNIHATATELLAASRHAFQVAQSSLKTGFVAKNKEGSWQVMPDKDNNMMALLHAVSALPYPGKQMDVIHDIVTNLSYDERERTAATKNATAQQVITLAKADKKAAQKLTGNAAAKAISKANAAIAKAEAQIDRTQYERPASVTDTNIAMAKTEAQKSEVKAVLDILHEMNKRTIDTLEQGGKIDSTIAKEWRKNQYYVPLKRKMDEDPGLVNHAKTGGTKSRDMSRFGGSDREVIDFVENVVNQRLYAVNAAMRNDAGIHAARELQAANYPGIHEFPVRPTEAKNVITLQENGDEKYFKLDDPNALRSFQGVRVEMPKFMDSAEWVTHKFRELVILNPVTMGRILARHTVEAWAYGHANKSLLETSGSVMRDFTKAMPGIAKELVTGTPRETNYEVKQFGFTGSVENTSMLREKQDILRTAMKAFNTQSGPKNWASKADYVFGAAHHMMMSVLSEAETVTREAAYKQTLAKTGSVTEAAAAARNTLDFRRRGDSVALAYASKLVPFFNTNLQGIYKVYRALVRNDKMGVTNGQARRTLAMHGMMMASAATAYSAMMQDNEAYQAIPKIQRDTNIMIPAGDGTFIKIPFPYEVGAMFWQVPTQLYNYMSGQQSGRELTQGLRDTVVEIMPGMLPQAIKPALEAGFNHDTFTNRPIESDRMQKKIPSERYTDQTSGVAKMLAAGPVSPVMMDHLLKGYFGTLGGYAINTVDALIGAHTGAPEQPGTKNPLVKGMFTDPLQSEHMEKFYELRSLTGQVASTFKDMVSSGRPEEARAFLNKEGPTGVQNSVMLGLNDAMQPLAKSLSEIRAAENTIRNSDASPEMKRAQIEQLKKSANEVVKKAMPTLRKYSGE